MDPAFYFNAVPDLTRHFDAVPGFLCGSGFFMRVWVLITWWESATTAFQTLHGSRTILHGHSPERASATAFYLFTCRVVSHGQVGSPRKYLGPGWARLLLGANDAGWKKFVSRILDGKNTDPGSGINIPDPQHWVSLRKHLGPGCARLHLLGSDLCSVDLLIRMLSDVNTFAGSYHFVLSPSPW